MRKIFLRVCCFVALVLVISCGGVGVSDSHPVALLPEVNLTLEDDSDAIRMHFSGGDYDTVEALFCGAGSAQDVCAVFAVAPSDQDSVLFTGRDVGKTSQSTHNTADYSTLFAQVANEGQEVFLTPNTEYFFVVEAEKRGGSNGAKDRKRSEVMSIRTDDFSVPEISLDTAGDGDIIRFSLSGRRDYDLLTIRYCGEGRKIGCVDVATIANTERMYDFTNSHLATAKDMNGAKILNNTTYYFAVTVEKNGIKKERNDLSISTGDFPLPDLALSVSGDNDGILFKFSGTDDYDRLTIRYCGEGSQKGACVDVVALSSGTKAFYFTAAYLAAAKKVSRTTIVPNTLYHFSFVVLRHGIEKTSAAYFVRTADFAFPAVALRLTENNNVVVFDISGLIEYDNLIIQYCGVNAIGACKDIAMLPNTQTSYRFTKNALSHALDVPDSKFLPDSVYYFSVVAVKSGGRKLSGSLSIRTPGFSAPIAQLSTEDNGDVIAFSLSRLENTDTVLIEYCGEGARDASCSEVGDLAKGITSFRFTTTHLSTVKDTASAELLPDTEYHFRVGARKNGVSKFGDVISIRTPGFSVPIAQLDLVDNDNVVEFSLSGQRNYDDIIIQYCGHGAFTATCKEALVLTKDIALFRFTATHLATVQNVQRAQFTPATSYHFRVGARKNGVSKFSSTITIRTQGFSAPRVEAVSANSNSAIRLKFTGGGNYNHLVISYCGQGTSASSPCAQIEGTVSNTARSFLFTNALFAAVRGERGATLQPNTTHHFSVEAVKNGAKKTSSPVSIRLLDDDNAVEFTPTYSKVTYRLRRYTAPGVKQAYDLVRAAQSSGNVVVSLSVWHSRLHSDWSIVSTYSEVYTRERRGTIPGSYYHDYARRCRDSQGSYRSERANDFPPSKCGNKENSCNAIKHICTYRASKGTHHRVRIPRSVFWIRAARSRTKFCDGQSCIDPGTGTVGSGFTCWYTKKANAVTIAPSSERAIAASGILKDNDQSLFSTSAYDISRTISAATDPPTALDNPTSDGVANSQRYIFTVPAQQQPALQQTAWVSGNKTYDISLITILTQEHGGFSIRCEEQLQGYGRGSGTKSNIEFVPDLDNTIISRPYQERSYSYNILRSVHFETKSERARISHRAFIAGVGAHRLSAGVTTVAEASFAPLSLSTTPYNTDRFANEKLLSRSVFTTNNAITVVSESGRERHYTVRHLFPSAVLR